MDRRRSYVTWVWRWAVSDEVAALKLRSCSAGLDDAKSSHWLGAFNGLSNKGEKDRLTDR